jgi:hypothetical protein
MPSGQINQPPADLLEHEFAQERASALGRLGRALEAALAALAQFDAGQVFDQVSKQVSDHASGRMTPADRRQRRGELVAHASIALWHFVVQREACGLRDMRYVLRDYRVPAEVAARMGVLPPQQGRPPRKT